MLGNRFNGNSNSNGNGNSSNKGSSSSSVYNSSKNNNAASSSTGAGLERGSVHGLGLGCDLARSISSTSERYVHIHVCYVCVHRRRYVCLDVNA